MTSQLISDGAVYFPNVGTAGAKVDPVNIGIYGETIPLLFGAARILGAPIWAAPVIDNDDGSRNVTAAYCFGHIDALTTTIALSKVWMDGQLAYDASNPNVNNQKFKFTFHGGAETEQPDPTIVQYETAARTPAFRDRVYIVVQGWYVVEGASFPQCTAEILQSVAGSDTYYVTTIGNKTASFGNDNSGAVTAMFLDADQGTLVMKNDANSEVAVYSTQSLTLIGDASPAKIAGQVLSLAAPSRVLPEYYAYGSGQMVGLDYYGNVTCTFPAITATFYGNAACSRSTAAYDQTIACFAIAGDGTATLQTFRRKGATVTAGLPMPMYGTTGNNGVPVAWIDQRKLSPNNDYVLGYFGYAKLLGLILRTDAQGSVVVVGNQTVQYTAADGVAGGSTTINPLKGSDTSQFVADLTNIGIDSIVAVVVDPVAAAWVAVLCYNVGSTGLIYLRFETPFAALGVVTPGHSIVGGAPQPLPPPTLQSLLYVKLKSQIALPFKSVAVSQQFQAACATLPYGQTTVYVNNYAANNTDQTHVFDFSDGSFRTFTAQGTFYAHDGSPIASLVNSGAYLGQNAAWVEAKGGCYYTDLPGGTTYPKPGLAQFYNNKVASSGSLTLASLFTSLGLLGGYSAPSIAIDASITDTITGAIIDQPTAFNDLVPLICELFRVDFLESGGLLKFKRKLKDGTFTADAVLYDADLATIDADGADDGATLKKERVNSADLPAIVQTFYLDSDNDFTIGAQSAKRTQYPVKTSAGANIEQIKVPVAMTASAALYWSEMTLFDLWAAALTMTFRVSQKWLALEPGDYVQLNTASFGVYVVKITDASLNDDFSLTCMAEVALVASPGNTNISTIATRQTSNDEPKPQPPSATPILTLYVVDNFSVVKSTGYETAPSLFLYSPVAMDVLVSYGSDTTITRTATGVVVGTLATTLPAITEQAPFSPNDDYYVQVNVPDANAPKACTNAQFLNAQNLILVGALGRWELISYRDVTKVSTGVYRLSHLLRGQNGSDTIGQPPQAGDVVILNPYTGLSTISYPTTGVGKNGAVRANLAGSSPYAAGALTIGLTLAGSDLKPRRVLHIRATNSSGAIVFTWDRQDRVATQMHDGDANQVMSETTEAYTIDFLSAAGAVLFSVTGLTAPTYTLAAADAATYGISTTSPIVRIKQVSSAVGGGFFKVTQCQVN